MPQAVIAFVAKIGVAAASALGMFAGGTGVAASTIYALGGAVIAGTALVAKKVMTLFEVEMPKIDTDRSRQSTVRSTTEPHKIIYGETLVSGPIVYANVAGTDNKHLYHAIALAAHEVEAITDIYLDNEIIANADIAATTTTAATSGRVTGSGTFAAIDGTTICHINKHLGTSTQAADSLLRDAFSSTWTTSHQGKGIAYIVTKFVLNDDSAEVWDKYAPNNIKAVVKGRKIYDPRLDSTQTDISGSGSHRLADSTTWEYSTNPALAVADYLMNADFGLGVSSSKIDWTAIKTAADACDATVNIPNGSGGTTTEKRFTCNGVLFGTDSHKTNINKLLSAMNGNMAYIDGYYVVRAGIYEAHVLDLDEDDLAGSIGIKTSLERSDRFNTIKGVFIDPSSNYKSTEFPKVQLSSAYSRDNQEELHKEIALNMTNSSFMAQRIAHKLIQQSNHQKIVTYPTNMKGLRVAVGDRVRITNTELGWTNKVYQCVQWSFNEEGGVTLTLREDAQANYADPTVTPNNEYSEITSDGTLTDAFRGVPAPSGLRAVSAEGKVFLDWVNPGIPEEFQTVHVLVSSDNNLSNAVKTGETDGTQFVHDSDNAATNATKYADGDTRYYWVRAVNFVGTSAQAQSSAHGSVSVTVTSAVAWTNVADSATIGIQLDTDDSIEIVYNAETQTSGSAIATSGIEEDVTITQGGITMSSGGAIKGGQTAFNSGTGFFLGYDSSAYKFSIGNSSGEKLTFDGTNLSVTGDVNATSGSFTGTVTVTAGETAPSISGTTLAGKGILLKSDGDMLIGDTAGKYLFFDQSAGEFLVNAQVETANFTLDPSAQVTGQIEASSVADGSITIADLSQTVWNEIDRRLSGVVGSTVGDYKTAAGNVGSGATNVDLAAFTHASNDITLELNIDDYWSSSNDYSGSALQATLQFQRSTDSSFPTSGEHATVDVGSAKTITIYQVDFSYMGGGYVYRVSYDNTETIAGLAAGTYYFRAKFTSAGSAWADDTSVAVNFFANEDGTGATATGGNANTLDSLDSTQFLRSDTDDTFDGDLTVTGTLILQGSIDQYNVTDLNVTDKTITVNSGNTQTLSDGAGLIVDRGTAADASLLWDETNDEFDLSHDLNLGTNSIQALQLHAGDASNYYVKAQAGSGTAINVQGNISASGEVNGTTISAGGNTIVDVSQNLQNIASISSGAITASADSTITTAGFTRLNINSTRTEGNIGGVDFQASGTIKAQIYGTVDGQIKLATNGSTVAATFDASQNATIAGSLTATALNLGDNSTNEIPIAFLSSSTDFALGANGNNFMLTQSTGDLDSNPLLTVSSAGNATFTGYVKIQNAAATPGTVRSQYADLLIDNTEGQIQISAQDGGDWASNLVFSNVGGNANDGYTYKHYWWHHAPSTATANASRLELRTSTSSSNQQIGGQATNSTSILNITDTGAATFSGLVTGAGVLGDPYLQTKGAAGAIGIFVDSKDSFDDANPAILNAPMIEWRESDGTNIAGIRGYVDASGNNNLALGTGFFDEEVTITSSGMVVAGTITSGAISSSGNIQQNYGYELRGKDSDGTVRTLLRTNSDKLQIGWSYAGDVEFMGGGSYTKRMAISGSTGDVSIVNDLSVSGTISSGAISVVDDSNPGITSGSLIIEGRRDGAANVLTLRARDADAPTDALPVDQGPVMRFQGFDGTDFENMAYIFAEADATIADGDAPSALKFGTSADGSSAPSLALTLDSSQNATFEGRLTVNGTAQSSFYGIKLSRSSTGLTTPDLWGENSTLVLGTSSSDERLALSTSGATIYGTITTSEAMASSPYIHHFDVSGSNTVGGGAGIVLQTSVTAGNSSTFGGKIEAVRTASDDGSADLKFYTSKASNSNGAHQLVLTLDEGKGATFAGDITVPQGQIVSDGTSLIIDGDAGKEVEIRSARDIRLVIDDNNDDETNEFHIYKHSVSSGNELLTVNQSGNATFAGTVTGGNGTFSNLTISATEKLRFDGAGGHTYIQESSNDTLTFATGGSARLTLNANATFSGKASVATSVSDGNLTVYGNSDSVPGLSIMSNADHGLHILHRATEGNFSFVREVSGTKTEFLNIARATGNATFSANLFVDSSDSLPLDVTGTTTNGLSYSQFVNDAAASTSNAVGLELRLNSSTQERQAHLFESKFTTTTDASRTSRLNLYGYSGGSQIYYSFDGGNLTLSSGTFTVNSGTTNVGATFTSSDAVSAIKLQDDTGNVELSSLGGNFRVQPSGSTVMFTVGTTGHVDALGPAYAETQLFPKNADEPDEQQANAALSGWVCMVASTVNIAVLEPDTVIYEFDPQTGNEEVWAVRNPSDTATLTTTVQRIYRTKGQPFVMHHQGAHDHMVPLAYAGNLFGWYSTRYNPQKIHFYAPTGGARVNIYQAPGGINGTIDYTFDILPNQFKQYTGPNATGTFFIEIIGSPLVAALEGTGGGDYDVLRPAARFRYFGDNTFGIGASVEMYDGSNATIAASNTVAYSYDAPVFGQKIGDGSGGDTITGVPLQMLCDNYLIPHTMDGITFTAPYPDTTIKVYEHDGSAWGLVDTYTLDGELTAPANTTDGPDLDGGGTGYTASGRSVLVVGNKPFLVSTNDNSDDEYECHGWLSKYYNAMPKQSSVFAGYDGTTSKPNFTFADDTNTGMWRSAADTLNFSTGGTERLELGTNRALFAANVQVGSDQASYNAYGRLQVNQAADNDESGIGILNASSGRSMRLWTDSTKSYINSGDGGAGDLVLNEAVTITSTGDIYAKGTASNDTPIFTFTGDTNTGLGYIGSDQVGLIAGGSRKFYVSSNTAYFQNLTNGVFMKRLTLGTDSEDAGELFINDTSTTSYTLGLIGTGTRGYTFRGSSSGGNYNLTFENQGTGLFHTTFRGNVYVADGSASAASYTFDNDTDTGFFRAGSGQVSVTANGTHAMTFRNYGINMTMNSNSWIDLNRSARITFYGDESAHHSIGSRSLTGGTSADLRVNSYRGFSINLDSNNNDTSSADFVVGRHGGTASTISNLFKIDGEDGDVTTSGNVTAYGSPSDIRLKENIEVIPDALNKVVSLLKGVTFNYKKDGSRSTGLLAQDLQKALPEVVYTATDIDTQEEHLAVRYGNTAGLLVEAIKELKRENDELKEMMKTIMEKINDND